MAVATKARRILMVHWDGAGNLPPQRTLTRELVRRGHEVHVLSHNSVAARVRADGATFHPLATARQYTASDRLAADEEIPFFLAEVIGSPAYSADFLGVVDRVRPDIFLIDWLLVSVLAAAIDLPTPCVALDHMLYDPDTWAPFFNPILGRAGASAAQLTYRGLLESLPLVLVFTYPAFSSRESFARCVEHVGPIREPVERADWPRGYPDRPFILVSLSTSFNQNQRAILQRICDALARLPVDALVTLGPNVAAEEISVRGGVELRTFVPHDQVLSSVDLIITHAGLGTVMAGAGAGVPLLCIPMGRDQPVNASRVEELGLGRVLSPAAAPGEIGDTVMDMLRDRSLIAASRAFAAGVRRFGDLQRAAGLVEAVC